MARTQVQSELIATNAISGTIIADNAITATHIATNSISGTLIQDSGIVTTMIAANNITSTKIVTDGVLTRHIADDQVTEDKLANAINTSIAAKLPLAGGTITGTIQSSTGDHNLSIGMAEFDSSNYSTLNLRGTTGGQMLVGRNSGANDWDYFMFTTNGLTRMGTAAGDDLAIHTNSSGTSNERMRILSGGNVGIGTDSPGATLHVDASGGANFQVSRTGVADMVYIEADGTNGVIRQPGDGALVFQMGGTSEKMRIGNTGKVSWSAGGIGTVATQSRDFTFYTEGSTNGVDIRSNDYQIAFIGGAGSSGAGMDKGYMQLCLDGGAKVAFNTDGNSFFNGGKLGIGEDEPNEPLTVRSSAENINTTLIEVGNDLHATNTKDAWIKFVAGAAQNDYSWAIGAYPTDFRFSYLGTRGTAVATAANVRLQIANNGRLTYNDTGTANAHATFVGEVGSGFKALAFERTVGGGEVGTIVANTSSTTYNTSSDYRLKENVDYSWDATTRLKQLKPARFNWIADDTNTLLEGFLAHEVSSIVPEAVSGEKDAMADPILYEDGDDLPSGKKVGDVKNDSAPEYQGIDHSKLVPLLVKTVQELEARIKTLEG